MYGKKILSTFYVLLAMTFSMSAFALTPEDHTAINTLIVSMQRSWNDGKIDEWNSYFADDADIVTSASGKKYSGIETISSLQKLFHSMVPGSQIENMPGWTVRGLTDDVAVVHLESKQDISSYNIPTLPSILHVQYTLTLVKKNGTWKIAASAGTPIPQNSSILTAL